MVGRAAVTPSRLRVVLDAVATVSSDITMDGLLERIVGVAATLAGARYGYLDVVDRRADRRLGRSARFGIDEAGLRASGPLPPGRQLLVDLIKHRGDQPAPTPGELAPFIYVPIESQGRPFGHLYLTDKVGGDGFSAEDDTAVLTVAAAAGVALENARLREQGDRQSRWLAAAAEITSTLRGPISRGEVVQLVADRMRDITSAGFVALLMATGDDDPVVAAVSGDVPGGLVGERVDPTDSLVGEAVRTKAPVVVPETANEPRYAPMCAAGWPDLGSLMVLPLSSDSDTGALVVGWPLGHQVAQWELDPVWPQRFADQAALVLQVARAREDLGRLAVFEDRDRIGRDLHDLVIQRLFAIGLRLDNTTKLVGSSEAFGRISSAIDEIDETIKDIRRTIFALNGASRTDDLRALFGEVIDKASGPLGFRPELRLAGPIDSVVADGIRDHLLAVLGEALSNIVRHAQASQVTVSLDVDDSVDLVVTNDGRRLGSRRAGTGLRNLRQRAKLLGGTCTVNSMPGGGVELRWSVPQ